MPVEVQYEICSKINGLEHVKFLRLGYAIEYDYVDPRELFLTLETKKIKNLYLAGQIMAQLAMKKLQLRNCAGINAALSIKNLKPFILDRSEAILV